MNREGGGVIINISSSSYMIGKKSQHFSFGTFAEVAEQDGILDKTNNIYSFCHSGSNETMQNVLRMMGFFLRSFEILFTF